MEIIGKLLALSFWEKFADLHGFLAMLSLVLFGASLILYFVVRKNTSFLLWLKNTLLALFFNLVLLDIAGLIIYIPYRATGGPRTILKAQEATAWLHTGIFEHKEFLAFAPPLLILTAFMVTKFLGSNFNDKLATNFRRSVLFAIVASIIIVLIVAAEAVLVTKAAPVR